MLLGDMGAEVIKIEDPRHGDDTRAWAPFVGGWSTYYLSVNRNKKSVAMDLKSARRDGRCSTDLIREADVLVENFRPGTLERLGFGAAQVRALNERLIYARISGYGSTGPRARRARLRHGDPGGVRADGRDRVSRDRTHQGRRGDHRLPGRALRRAGHPARPYPAA